MTRRPPKSILLALLALVLAVPLAACGEQKIEVPRSETTAHAGAELFQQRCAGCHTFRAAGTMGSASDVSQRERTDGPNFDTRPECVQRVLYAIQNGGFSGAIMPANIVVGEEAQQVADFVARYAGQDATGQRPPGSGSAENGFQCTSARVAGEQQAEPDVGTAATGDEGSATGSQGQSGDE